MEKTEQPTTITIRLPLADKVRVIRAASREAVQSGEKVVTAGAVFIDRAMAGD